MSPRTQVSDPRPVEIKTLNQLFYEAVDRHGDHAAFGRITSDMDLG